MTLTQEEAMRDTRTATGVRATPPRLPDAHVEALATVNGMRDEILALREREAALTANYNRVEDRCSLLMKERNYYRDEAHAFRTKLVELATVQTAVTKLLSESESVLKSVYNTIGAPPPGDHVEKLTDVVDAAVNAINAANITHTGDAQ